MFTEEEILAYRNIKAPDSLRQKIIGKEKNHKSAKIIGFITAVAACFAVIITGIVISHQSKIVVNGQNLTDSVEFYYAAPASERSASHSVTVPIQFDVRETTKISVSDGKIGIKGSPLSKDITITSPKEVLWEVEPDSAQCEFEMIITNKKGVQKVTLKYDNTKITITKENTK